MLKKLLSVLLFLHAAAGVSAQKTDSAAAVPAPVRADSLATCDTVQAASARRTWLGDFFQKDRPIPRRALLLSFALPGAGQAYNHSWWKLPLVYGAFGGMIWLENNNLTAYRERKTAYFNKVNDLPVLSPYDRYDKTTLKALRDEARKNFELSSVLLGATYLLAAAEAFVDAHLQHFDVSDDLSLQIRPSVAPNTGFGLGICLQLERPASSRSSFLNLHP